MKAKEVRDWRFEIPVTDYDEIQCQHCEKWSQLSEWTIGSVDCETCGDHDSMDCPLCCYEHDHVHARPFKVSPPIVVIGSYYLNSSGEFQGMCIRRNIHNDSI